MVSTSVDQKMFADDALLLTVGLSLTHNSTKFTWPEGWALSMGCGESSGDIADLLRELADAIDEHRAFGFMMTQLYECHGGAGELQPVKGAIIGPGGQVVGINHEAK